ncbi:hypothetical protein HDU85_005941 [Gaertneriomyces sp. JEL0708]|nr:hypothetical protein HDU85_005941 [Gaertneriomyces sp. JEL0708]
MSTSSVTTSLPNKPEDSKAEDFGIIYLPTKSLPNKSPEVFKAARAAARAEAAAAAAEAVAEAEAARAKAEAARAKAEAARAKAEAARAKAEAVRAEAACGIVTRKALGSAVTGILMPDGASVWKPVTLEHVDAVVRLSILGCYEALKAPAYEEQLKMTKTLKNGQTGPHETDRVNFARDKAIHALMPSLKKKERKRWESSIDNVLSWRPVTAKSLPESKGKGLKHNPYHKAFDQQYWNPDGLWDFLRDAYHTVILATHFVSFITIHFLVVQRPPGKKDVRKALQDIRAEAETRIEEFDKNIPKATVTKALTSSKKDGTLIATSVHLLRTALLVFNLKATPIVLQEPAKLKTGIRLQLKNTTTEPSVTKLLLEYTGLITYHLARQRSFSTDCGKARRTELGQDKDKAMLDVETKLENLRNPAAHLEGISRAFEVEEILDLEGGSYGIWKITARRADFLEDDPQFDLTRIIQLVEGRLACYEKYLNTP